MGNAIFQGLTAPKPFDGFSKNFAQLVTSATTPHMQMLGSIGSKEACLRMREVVAVRRLFFSFLQIDFYCFRLVAINIALAHCCKLVSFLSLMKAISDALLECAMFLTSKFIAYFNIMFQYFVVNFVHYAVWTSSNYTNCAVSMKQKAPY